MYEHRTAELLPFRTFLGRLALHSAFATAVVAVSLTIGTLGYHGIAKLEWVDALLDASMILAGMGPVHALDTNAAKLWASAYALFSGVVFLTTVGILWAPLLHRLLHRLHLDEAER